MKTESILDKYFPEEYKKEQLTEMYQKLPLPMETVNTIHDYFTAASNLYGIIPVKKLMEIYNQQNTPVSQDDFLAVTKVIRHEHNYFAVLGVECFYEEEPCSAPEDREVVAEHLYCCDDEAYYELVDAQQGKPFAVLPKEEFLRFADEFYYPSTLETENMLAYLRKKRRNPGLSAQDLLDEIMLHIVVDDDLDYLFDELNRLGLKFSSEKEVDEFMKRYVPLSNRSRKLSNRGNTSEELGLSVDRLPAFQMYSKRSSFCESIPTTVSGAPSRNAPCPCGSGRKYKNCCGKK